MSARPTAPVAELDFAAAGRLLLTDKDPKHSLTMPIDLFLRSLAQDCGAHAIGVILSGTGSDGSMGVKAIKKMGGTVIVQDEKSSQFFGMPGAALQTGSVDFILPLDEIPSALLTLVSTGDVS